MTNDEANDFLPTVLDYLAEATESGELTWDGTGAQFWTGPWTLVATDRGTVTGLYDGSFAFDGDTEGLLDLYDEIAQSVGVRTVGRIKTERFPF